MRSIQDFLWQAMKFSVARGFIDNGDPALESSLNLADSAIRQEELRSLDRDLDNWVWFSPFRISWRGGSFIELREVEHNPSEFHGNYWVTVDSTARYVKAMESKASENIDRGISPIDYTNPWRIPDSELYSVPLQELAPDLDYDRLKKDLERIVSIAGEEYYARERRTRDRNW